MNVYLKFEEADGSWEEDIISFEREDWLYRSQELTDKQWTEMKATASSLLIGAMEHALDDFDWQIVDEGYTMRNYDEEAE